MSSLISTLEALRGVDTVVRAGIPSSIVADDLAAADIGFVAVGSPLGDRWYQALSELASPPIRHVATLVGNLCSASPAADSIPALVVLEASVDIDGPAGRRSRMAYQCRRAGHV